MTCHSVPWAPTYIVMVVTASKEIVDVNLTNKDENSLINTITGSYQVMSVINDTGDHVLRLSFMNSSPVNHSSQRRYLI